MLLAWEGKIWKNPSWDKAEQAESDWSRDSFFLFPFESMMDWESLSLQDVMKLSEVLFACQVCLVVHFGNWSNRT